MDTIILNQLRLDWKSVCSLTPSETMTFVDVFFVVLHSFGNWNKFIFFTNGTLAHASCTLFFA